MKWEQKVSSPLDRSVDAARRKRLGQYFTGVGLGRLLAALAQAEQAKSILDPMAGSGDLLASCLEIGARPALLAGIEIDATACNDLSTRLPEAYGFLGNAFAPNTVKQLPTKSWDLVIANPPYVRYQSLSIHSDASHALPSAAQIRMDLLQTLELMHALDAEDKQLFAHLVKGYSGLSDLAVPAWILCAALVKEGGRLALVVPESWLSRDYAAIVHYLLFRWFDVEFVVEDEHASWFETAQIKTTLIVAKRVKRRTSALAIRKGSNYCHIAVSSLAASMDSPIGRIPLPEIDPERNFAKQAQLWLRNATSHQTGLLSARPISLEQACNNVVAAASRQKWFSTLGEPEVQPTSNVYIPHEIYHWLLQHNLHPVFQSMESQGILVGQGLRTGANSFFYADGMRKGERIELSFSGPLEGLRAEVPPSVVRPSLRRQSELPSGFVFSPAIAKGWVLDLRGHALTEDLKHCDIISAPYESMPDTLVKVIKAAALANFGTADRPRRVWDLSAVAPNIRTASRSAAARYWYMLPDFAARHTPDVMIARVNSSTPKAYLNKGRECLIDANFSTLWTLGTSQWSAHALLAFMNCSWAQALIELSGAVMGGGALKVEATHLRRLPLPYLGKEQLEKLSTFGERLAQGEDSQKVIALIDDIVAQALGCDDGATTGLRQITRVGQARRAKHKGK